MDFTILEDLYNKKCIQFEDYLNYEFKVFFDLRILIEENLKCLSLEFHLSSILLSNYILERLMKNALIFNEVGIESIPIEKWEIEFERADRYSSMDMSETIKECKKMELITLDEFEHLNEKIRNIYRNGFSHADPKKILTDLDDKRVFFTGSFNKPNSIQPIQLNTKTIPSFQALFIDSYCKLNSEVYCQFIFELVINMEARLIKKYRNS